MCTKTRETGAIRTRKALRRHFGTLRGSVLIVGVGDRLRGDDGAGSVTAGKIGDAGLKTTRAIDTGTTPENHLEAIVNARADCVVFVDALAGEDAPGTVTVLRPHDVAETGTSTHMASLRMVFDYLSAAGIRDMRVLGIQPQTTGISEGLSPRVREAVNTVIAFFTRRES